MNKHLLQNRKSLLTINLIVGLFANTCFSMEKEELEPTEESLEVTKVHKRILDLQQAERIGKASSFSTEFGKFAKEQPYTQAIQQKQYPDLDISQIRNAIAIIEHKITELKFCESLLIEQPQQPQDLKFDKQRSVGFKTLQIFEVEQQLNIIRDILAKDAQDLSQKEKSLLYKTLQELSGYIIDYIESLDQRVENLKKQIQFQQKNSTLQHDKL